MHCNMGVNITLTRPAYERLKKLKEPGESFSDMVIRELPERADTLGELLDYWDKREMPKGNPKRAAELLARRGNRAKK